MSSRDFVYLFKIGYEGDSWVMGGKSVDYKDAPKASGIVRAVNGPGLQMVTPCQVNKYVYKVRNWMYATLLLQGE